MSRSDWRMLAAVAIAGAAAFAAGAAWLVVAGYAVNMLPAGLAPIGAVVHAAGFLVGPALLWWRVYLIALRILNH